MAEHDDDMLVIRETLGRIETKLDATMQKVGCCTAPGCKTLTLSRYCAKHAPLAGWAIAEATRDEVRKGGMPVQSPDRDDLGTPAPSRSRRTPEERTK